MKIVGNKLILLHKKKHFEKKGVGKFLLFKCFYKYAQYKAKAV